MMTDSPKSGRKNPLKSNSAGNSTPTTDKQTQSLLATDRQKLNTMLCGHRIFDAGWTIARAIASADDVEASLRRSSSISSTRFARCSISGMFVVVCSLFVDDFFAVYVLTFYCFDDSRAS
jgi:hypothetical protein